MPWTLSEASRGGSMTVRSRFRLLAAVALLATPNLTLAGPPEPIPGGWDYERARQLNERAEALAKRPELAATVDAACKDPELHAALLANPGALLDKAGLSLPEGLGIETFERTPRTMPFPGWTPFLVE